MAIKPIKVITGIDCWDTKIYEGDEDITEKIGGIFGIDIRLRVDEIPQMKLEGRVYTRPSITRIIPTLNRL